MRPTSIAEKETAALQAYVSSLQEHFGPRLVDVLLFGSQARGEARPGSDIDVVVTLDHPDPQDLSFARGLAFDIWLSHQVFLSVRAMSREGWQHLAAMQSLFYRNVIHDGISLIPAQG